MAEYIDIDQPLIFKDIHNRDVTGTIRTILRANHTELVLADVVPVVRCKNCRHIHIGQDVYYCRYWEKWGLTPDGFCSVGAKMDGEA